MLPLFSWRYHVTFFATFLHGQAGAFESKPTVLNSRAILNRINILILLVFVRSLTFISRGLLRAYSPV